MKPYYQDESVTLYCANNRDVLPHIPDCDHMITDPPYAENTHVGARTNPTTQDGRWLSGGNEGQDLINFDHISFSDLRDTFSLASLVVKKWSVSFMDWHHIAMMEETPPLDMRFVRFGMWHKPNGAPQFTGDRPAQGWEGVCIMHKVGGRMAWNGGGHAAVYTYNKTSHPIHRTAKPPQLVCKLIEQFTNPGDTVLDPFAGVSTTLECAKLMGRKAVGIEMNEAYCEYAAKRLSQAVMF